MKNRILQEFLNSNIKINSQDKLNEYIDYCIEHNQNKRIRDEKGYSKTSHHHILPDKLFKEYNNLKENSWNGAHLMYSKHYNAHWLLTEAIDDYGQLNAFTKMHNMDIKNGRITEEDLIPEEEFQTKMEERGRKHSQWCQDNPIKMKEISRKISENPNNIFKTNHPFSIENSTKEKRQERSKKSVESRSKIKESGLSSFQEGALKGANTKILLGISLEACLKGVQTMKNDIDENGLNGIQRRSNKSADSKRGQRMAEKTCPYCNKTGRGGNMKRYHFENCKTK